MVNVYSTNILIGKRPRVAPCYCTYILCLKKKNHLRKYIIWHTTEHTMYIYCNIICNRVNFQVIFIYVFTRMITIIIITHRMRSLGIIIIIIIIIARDYLLCFDINCCKVIECACAHTHTRNRSRMRKCYDAGDYTIYDHKYYIK